MPRNKKSKKKLPLVVTGIGSVFVVIVIASLMGISVDEVIGSSEQIVEIPTNLPGLSFTDVTTTGSSQNNESVFFKIKHSTYVVDENSKVLLSSQSSGISGFPNLVTNALIDPSSGQTIGGSVTIPKIFVTYPNVFKPNLTFDPSLIEVVVLGEQPNGTFKVVAHKSINSFSFTYGPDAQGATAEVPFGSIGINGADIYDDMALGTYNSKLIFKLGGTLNFHYTDFPAIKMKVPLNSNLLQATYTARITDDNPVTDRDFDGISDNDGADQCPDQQENYNGFEDTDGCPDTPPTQQPPIVDCTTTTDTCSEPGDPTPQEQCIADGDLWLNGVCVDDSSTGPTGETLESRDVFAVVAVKTNYLDGSSTSRAYTDDSFGFTLNSLIEDIGGREKSVGSLEYTTYIGSFGSALQGLKIQSADIKFKGTVDIASKELTIATKTGAGASTSEATSLTLPDLDTTISFNGIVMSKATFTSVEIHNIIKSYSGIELVPEGQQRDLNFIVDISGPVVMKSTSASITDTVEGTLVGASVNFSGLSLLNNKTPVPQTGTYGTFGEAEDKCGGAENVKAVDGRYACIPGVVPTPGKTCADDEYVKLINGIEECVKIGSTVPDEKPIIGEPGVDICYDANHPRSGSLEQLTCTVEYRGLWCNGGHDCVVPPTPSGPDCNDTASCPTKTCSDGFTVLVGESCPTTDDSQCTVPEGFHLNSIADNICVNISPDEEPKVTVGCFTTPPITSQSITKCLKDGWNIDLNDPTTLGITIVGGIILLMAIFKRDSRYSPIPASPTQFSR